MKKTYTLIPGVLFLSAVIAYSQPLEKTSVPGACGNCNNPVPLDGNNGLGLSFNQSGCGLNYVAATQVVQTRYGPSAGCGNSGCSWNISGLPPCISFASGKALVWALCSYQSGPFAATITITNPQGNTLSYTASPIGTSVHKCWTTLGEVGTCVYRWDVTPSIAGNGNYAFSFSGMANPAFEVDGATMFIVYQDLSATYDGALIFWDGAYANNNGGTISQTLTGFNVCATPSTATAFMLTSDHQNNVASSHNSTMNGNTYSFPNLFSNFQVVNTTLTAGQNSTFFADNGGGIDCFLWGMAGIYYQSNCTSCTPSGLTVSQAISNAACGQNNGSITLTPNGGIGPYTYVWTPAVAGNTNSASGLPAGTYQISVTDAVGCNSVVNVTINGSPGPTVSASSTPAGCTVANGSATANPSGGTPGYTYAWSNGDSNQTANNLSAGTYTVIVTDANGCSVSDIVTISSTSPPTTSSSVVSNVLCNGGTTGSATTNPSGGTPGYAYQWSPGGGNGQTANNLPAGSYVVTITDANGCTVTDNVTITEPPAINVTSTQTNVLCNGGNNGSATANASGGTPGYNYSWNTSPVQNTQTANNLSAGTYNCTVTDANGCTSVVSVTITQPPALTASSTQNNVTCNGGNNGSATASMNGGSAPYTYSWNTAPPQTTPTANNLSAGTYQCTITDANGCTAQVSVTITQPSPVSLSITCGDSICAGDSTLLTASASGGTIPYSYNWMPGNLSGPSVPVSPATSTVYTVSVTDANGCNLFASQTCMVTVLPAPTAQFDTASSGVFGSTWSFSDLSSGGTGWIWNFGDGSAGSTQQNPVHTFPGSGTYTVTQVVFNQFGCPDTFALVLDITEGIIIPNVFTPDGNGQNDVWYIPNSGMKEYHVEIYDRWGLKVWEATADEIRWDGRSTAGKLLTDGTYYYVLRAILKSTQGDKNYSREGYISLLTEKR